MSYHVSSKYMFLLIFFIIRCISYIIVSERNYSATFLDCLAISYGMYYRWVNSTDAWNVFIAQKRLILNMLQSKLYSAYFKNYGIPSLYIFEIYM